MWYDHQFLRLRDTFTYISILTYNNVTLTEKKKGLLSLFILERLFRLLLYVYIFSLLFFYFFFFKMDLILKKVVCLTVLETNNIIEPCQ